MTTHEEETCFACRGTGTGETYDDDGRRDPCSLCDGSGSIVVCLHGPAVFPQCRGHLPAPEAETEGAYCSKCREWLDVSASEAAQ